MYNKRLNAWIFDFVFPQYVSLYTLFLPDNNNTRTVYLNILCGNQLSALNTFLYLASVLQFFFFSFFSPKGEWQEDKEVVLFVHISEVPSIMTHNRSAVV